MQLQVLISFFFAYMAAVKAAPIQLPTEGAVEVPSVPALPNLPRALPVDIGPNPVVDEFSIPAPPVTPRALSFFQGKDLEDLLKSIKSEGIAQTLPVSDDVPNALEDTEGLPAAVVSLPSVAMRAFARGIPPLPVDITPRQLDTTTPSLPSVPVADNLLKRQVDVPEVPNAGDVPLPPTPSVPAKLVTRQGALVPDTPIIGELFSEFPSGDLAVVGKRQEDLPSTPNLEEITLPTVPFVPAKLPVRSVADAAPLGQVEVPELPADATKLVDTAAAVEGLTIRQVPEVPELPAVPSTDEVPGSILAAL